MTLKYKCPLCGSLLSKGKFDRVTKIDTARAEQLHEAHLQVDSLKAALRSAKANAKQAHKDGERKGRDSEKKRAERLTRGLRTKLTIANERIRQLEKGTTPQTDGLEFEEQLALRLQQEFPSDDVVHEGRECDIRHTIIVKNRPVGLIVYECKRHKRIDRKHIEQAARDKRSRQADFAILVTTGARRGFSGLAHDGQVLIVAPLAVVALAHLVRDQIIQISRARLSRGERERVAIAALEYLTSPVFSGPLEEALMKARRAQDLLKKEYEDHVRIWHERWGLYQTIDLDLVNIGDNVQRLRDGGKPISLGRARPAPLQLPAVAGSGP